MTALHETLLRLDAAWADRPAVSTDTVSWTYLELRRAMLQTAAWLQSEGLGAGDRVGVCLPKSLESVQALLGILASGACFVPLDSQAPAGHIARVVSQARLQRLITFPRVADALHSAADVPPLTVLPAVGDGCGWTKLVERYDGAEITLAPSAQNAAVIYFTSGSTGTPKGVVLTHENVGSFVRWATTTLGLRAQDRLISHAPLHFDLSTLDLFGTFQVGASVRILDETAVKFPARVSQILERERITVTYTVPTVWYRLLEQSALDSRDLTALRLVLFAGEAFAVRSLHRLMQQVPQAEYVNLYGPTETNVCTYYRVPPSLDSEMLALPIGKPCEHLEVTVYREDGGDAAVGESGEICVRGAAVMQGYCGEPQLTAAVRLQGRADSYRTGDFGYWGADGNLYLVGRRDNQVKIRGHRVELGEIESVLCSHSGVLEAAVVLSKRGGEAELIAFLTARNGQPPDIKEVRRHCAQLLASHAVPDRVHWMAELPRTSTGKIDRRQLQQSAAAVAGGLP